MKKLALGSIIVLFIGLFGFGGYMAALEIASEQVVKQISNAISEDDLELLIKDPTIQALLNDPNSLKKNLDSTELPFKTKEEAIKRLKEKFSFKEIKTVLGKFKGGLSVHEQNELYTLVTSRLTDAEFTALQIIAIKEMRKNEES